MSICSVNYAEIEQELEDAIGWLRRIGINPNRGRFGFYHKALKELFDTYQDERARTKNDFPVIVNAIYEVFDLIDIYKGLSESESKELPSLAQFYQKGVNCYSDENIKKSGNRARNTAFELIVSSKLYKSGINIDLSNKCDVSGTFENNRILIECKRIQKVNKIESNVSDAKNQLREKILNPEYPRTCGIIALDFTKLLNPDFDLLVKPDEASVLSGLDQATNVFVKKYQNNWQKSLGRNVIGVLTYFSLMAVVEDRNLLTHCKQYAFCQTSTISPRWHAVSWRLAQQLGATSKEVIIA